MLLILVNEKLVIVFFSTGLVPEFYNYRPKFLFEDSLHFEGVKTAYNITVKIIEANLSTLSQGMCACKLSKVSSNNID